MMMLVVIMMLTRDIGGNGEVGQHFSKTVQTLCVEEKGIVTGPSQPLITLLPITEIRKSLVKEHDSFHRCTIKLIFLD